MKKTIIVIFILLNSFYLKSQTVDDYLAMLSEEERKTFQALPENIKDQIIKNLEPDKNISSQKEEFIPFEDTVLNINISSKANSPDFQKFGYEFFSGIPTTYTPVNDIPVPSEYIVGIGDVFEINYRGNKFGKYELIVDKSGKINIPEVGELSVIELSFEEVKANIKNAFKDYYLSVEASVSLKELKFIQVSVLGAVKNPGSYLVNPFTSASNLLSFAGGLEAYASLRNIELRGSQQKVIDMYEYLIGGKREDLVLRSGDILFVPSSSNFILLHGSVNRPAYYEFKEGESVKDLIEYGQNLSRLADKNTFQIKQLKGNEIISRVVSDSKDVINLNNITEIFIPEITPNVLDNIYVYGGVSDSGPYEVADFNLLSELLDSIKFTENLYPYFAILESVSNSNYKNEYFPFSVFDKNTQKNIKLKSGSKLYFFSKANFLEDINYSENLSSAVKKIINAHSVTFSGEFLNNVSMPVYGEVSLLDLLDYVGGFTPNADRNRVEVIFPLEEKTIFNPNLNLKLQSPLNASINVPKFNSEIIQVEILGEVSNPGIYPVLSGTTLNELYEKAGNFRDTASADAIVFLRETLKNKEELALEVAKSTLINSFIDNLSNNSILNKSANVNGEILTLLNQAVLLEPQGRLSGDLSPGSAFSTKLLLQDGDVIYVAPVPQTVTVFGEVNNPATLTYDKNFSFSDYLNKAGGLKNSGDKSNIFVIKSDGTSYTLNQRLFSLNSNKLLPGDTIIVPKDLDNISGLPLVRVTTEILSSLAFSAASLNAIRN